ncbi:hypothetical protein EVAR_19020_1 [Eumeta japonica]|uniref:Uncharacterized protein n=1 Tax=Eumeta variegata TaxID=151549 RepID=A0A4C1V7G3_EUMVA|nr:hypothetical protein EVAR_19020_1 [Eumeta japonica]
MLRRRSARSRKTKGAGPKMSEHLMGVYVSTTRKHLVDIRYKWSNIEYAIRLWSCGVRWGGRLLIHNHGAAAGAEGERGRIERSVDSVLGRCGEAVAHRRSSLLGAHSGKTF